MFYSSKVVAPCCYKHERCLLLFLPIPKHANAGVLKPSHATRLVEGDTAGLPAEVHDALSAHHDQILVLYVHNMTVCNTLTRLKWAFAQDHCVALSAVTAAVAAAAATATADGAVKWSSTKSQVSRFQGADQHVVHTHNQIMSCCSMRNRYCLRQYACLLTVLMPPKCERGWGQGPPAASWGAGTMCRRAATLPGMNFSVLQVVQCAQ